MTKQLTSAGKWVIYRELDTLLTQNLSRTGAFSMRKHLPTITATVLMLFAAQAQAGVTTAQVFTQDSSYASLVDTQPSTFVHNIAADQTSFQSTEAANQIGTFDSRYTTALSGNPTQPETTTFTITLTNNTDSAILFASLLLKDVSGVAAAFVGTPTADTFSVTSSSTAAMLFEGSLAVGGSESFTTGVSLSEFFNGNFTLQFNSGVPEPSSLIIFGIAGVVFAGRAAKKLRG